MRSPYPHGNWLRLGPRTLVLDYGSARCSRGIQPISPLSVVAQAQPTLEGNACTQNGQDGIMYAGSASGLARENKCSENGLHGIEVQDEARPTLEANVCSGNAQAGIGYSDAAGGVARGNDCSGNKWGIYVAETADPELADNDCRDNTSEDLLDLCPAVSPPASSVDNSVRTASLGQTSCRMHGTVEAGRTCWMTACWQ
ncbi:MAG: right-handed parallel beta-helix repeat-containing protein [Anaerolineae bacterium]